jgi:hypothetical protein
MEFQMANKAYLEKLKDPRWQKLRLEVFQRDVFCCRQCGSESNTLCVHHRRYLKGNEPWEYPLELLITLCEECHVQETEQMPISFNTLLMACKDRLFSSDVHQLACAIRFANFKYPPEVTMSMLEWVLENTETQEKIMTDYLERHKPQVVDVVVEVKQNDRS